MEHAIIYSKYRDCKSAKTTGTRNCAYSAVVVNDHYVSPSLHIPFFLCCFLVKNDMDRDT